MKKLLILFIFCVSYTNAQSLRYGVKGGLNISQFTKTENEMNPKMGFHLGGLVEFQVTQKFYVQPELLFSTLGANQYINTVNQDIRLSYLSIPVVGKFYLKGGFCIEGGVYASFNVGATQGKNENSISLSETTSSLDYGVCAGINYILPNSLSFGARFNMGTNGAFENDDETQNTVQNAFLQLSVAYFL